MRYITGRSCTCLVPPPARVGHPQVNEDPKDAMLREFQEEIEKLKAKLTGERGEVTYPPTVPAMRTAMRTIAMCTPCAHARPPRPGWGGDGRGRLRGSRHAVRLHYVAAAGRSR